MNMYFFIFSKSQPLRTQKILFEEKILVLLLKALFI